MSKHIIAIIDDGVNQKLFTTGELKHNLHITTELDICERIGYDPFLPSHGTTCAAIIKKYAPDAVLSSIKILSDESRKGMKKQLIKSLEWCADNGASLVNLSLGTTDFKDFLELENAVNHVVEKGVIIVAACSNRNIFTCPASFENVIGVKGAHSKIIKKQQFIYNKYMPDGIDITACGCHRLNKFNGEKMITSACNSFAAPAVTAFVYNMLKNSTGMSINHIKEKLKKSAVKPNIYTSKLFKSDHTFKENITEHIKIPIVVLYNYCSISVFIQGLKEIVIGLAERFRKEGYNAIAVLPDYAEKDYCRGIVPITSTCIEKSSLAKELGQIYTAFDPDMIIIPIDTTRAIKDNKMDIESHYEIDIRINIYQHRIEVISEEGSRAFEIKNYIDIDELYIYVLALLS